MHSMENLFIVGKPLQVIVAASIIKQLKIANRSKIVIFDSFFDAKETYERLKSASGCLRPVTLGFADTPRKAIEIAKSSKIENVFIDSDVGFRRYTDLALLKLVRPEIKINVFEEGLGTYRTDLYSGLKKKLFDLIGIGTNYGGCSLTNNVYVFNDNQYANNFPESKSRICKIIESVVDIINDDIEYWIYIMNYGDIKPSDPTHCNVYLTSWNIDSSFIQEFLKMSGDKFIKPHPHLKERLNFAFTGIVAPAVPAELVLLDLSKKYNVVNVFHHGTSAKNYVVMDNVFFILRK